MIEFILETIISGCKFLVMNELGAIFIKNSNFLSFLSVVNTNIVITSTTVDVEY